MWFCCETLSFKFQAINGRALHWNLPQVCLCFLDFNSLCRQINKQTNTYSHTITTNWQVWWRLSHLLFLARSFSFLFPFSILVSILVACCLLFAAGYWNESGSRDEQIVWSASGSKRRRRKAVPRGSEYDCNETRDGPQTTCNNTTLTCEPPTEPPATSNGFWLAFISNKSGLSRVG